MPITITELPDDWLTTAQVAQAIKRSERVVQQMAKDGKLRCKPRPGHPNGRLYDARDVRKYLPSDPEPEYGNTAEAPRSAPKSAPPKGNESPRIVELLETIDGRIKTLCEEFKNGREHERLTIGEAASFLRLPKAHLQRAINEGRLAAVKAGGVWRIRRSVLETFEG